MELTWVLNKLWIVVSAWWWFDRRNLESRIKDLEADSNQFNIKTSVLESKLDSLKELIESKFTSLHEDIKQLKSK